MADQATAPSFAARTFPTFAIVSTIAYFLFMGFGFARIIYYPEVGVLRWKVDPDPALGPPMLWYSWCIAAPVVGAIAAGLAWLVPARFSAALLTGRLGILLWLVPAVVTLIILYLLRHYF